MQIQDLYKLLHQAAMGSEHAISDTQQARKWMEHELAEMGPGPDEPLLDPISADGRIARVHLRPLVQQGGDPQALVDAFVRTANELHGNGDDLSEYWSVAVAMQLFPLAEMNDFLATMRAKQYPAVHHSSVYERLYRPAYRVILREYMP